MAHSCSWSQQELLRAPFPQQDYPSSLRPGSVRPRVSQDRQGLRQDLLGAGWELNARAVKGEGR